MEGEITSTAKKLVATGTSGLVLLETEMQVGLQVTGVCSSDL